MLIAKNISHSFEYPLFNDISINLKEKQAIAIIGSSGLGKSSLLYILSSFLEPQSGTVEIFNKDIYKLNQKELIEFRKKYLGIIFQTHYLFKGFTALENILTSAIISSKEIDYNLINKLKIENVLKQKITELSGGQQQRVSIARVLTKKPKIIFADEPTGNLDKNSSFNIMDILFEYINKEHASLILVSHDQNLAFKCDKVYELKDLKLIALK